jgi:putative tricarboxylic transport membrane protein
MALEIILLVLAVAGIWEGFRLSKSVMLFVDPVGPGWYLFFMACLLFVCATVLLAKQIKRRKAGLKEARLSLQQGPAGRALLLLLLYGIAAMFLGYVIASALFFILAQRIFGERSWLRCAVIGVSITGCFYFVFSYLAGMPLP